MKKMFLLLATGIALVATQSCSKCGHCHTEASYLGTTQKDDGSIYCGNSSNESGSYAKAAELSCKAWPSRQTPQTGVTYTSSWETDK